MGLRQDQINKILGATATASADQLTDAQKRAQEMKMQRADADSRLSQLITGKDMDADNMILGKEFDEASGQRNIDANVQRVRQEMARSGVDPSKSSMSFNESGASYNPDVDPMGKAVKKAMMGANITGYNVADPDRVIPTVKDAEEVKKATGSLKALQGTGTEVQGRFKDAGPLDRFGSVRIPFTNKQLGTEKGIALDSGITDMVLQLKELANLGAITGPDMALMESAMGNITGVGALIGNKDRAIQQLNDVMKRARSKVETNATSRGYAPQQGYLDAPSVPGAPKAGAPSFEEWKRMKAGK